MQKIRSDASPAAAAWLHQVYGKRYNAQLAREGQQEVAVWLGKATQPTSIQEFLNRAEKKPHYISSYRKDTPER